MDSCRHVAAPATPLIHAFDTETLWAISFIRPRSSSFAASPVNRWRFGVVTRVAVFTVFPGGWQDFVGTLAGTARAVVPLLHRIMATVIKCSDGLVNNTHRLHPPGRGMLPPFHHHPILHRNTVISDIERFANISSNKPGSPLTSDHPHGVIPETKQVRSFGPLNNRARGAVTGFLYQLFGLTGAIPLPHIQQRPRCWIVRSRGNQLLSAPGALLYNSSRPGVST